MFTNEYFSGSKKQLLLVVGGNDGAASHAVDLLSLDTSIDDPECLKGLLNDFPAKLEGATGTTLGALNLPTSLLIKDKVA